MQTEVVQAQAHKHINRAFQAEYEGITHERYASGLAAFRAWYLQSYSDEPDAALLTDDEARDYRVCLTGVKGHKAATVNAYLAPMRALVRAYDRTLKVKVLKQVQVPVETLDARDLGRLINAVDGPHWSDNLAKNPGEIATLATILGHANITTTTRYLHPNAQRVQEMVEEM